MEGSDWRAELLRAIGYVFTKERETLLAELRSHVLSHPSTNLDETQRLEQKIRTMVISLASYLSITCFPLLFLMMFWKIKSTVFF